MATLTSEYQYIGRSSEMRSQSGSYSFYILLYAKTAPNDSTGYHNVTIKQVLSCTANSSFYQYGTTFSGAIAGTTVFSGSNKPWTEWEIGTFTEGGHTYKKGTVIAEGSKQVDCTDGTAKSITLTTTWKFTVTGASYTPEKNASGTVTATATLPAIPRATEITATDANIGSTSTVIFNTKNANFRHTLAYTTGSTYTTIFEKQSYTTYGWTVPTSIYAQIPNAKGCNVTLRCQTYSGDTLIGTKYAYIYVTASEEVCKPSITVTTCQDINPTTVALTGDATKIVKGQSNVRVVVTATGNNSATISSVKVICGGKTLTGADVTITGAESKDIVITAIDSRGYSNSESPVMTLVDYFPVIATLSVGRISPTSDTVNIGIRGKYFNGSFGTASNTLSAKARFALTGGTYGEDITIPVVATGNEYTATGSLTGLDYDKTYDVQITYTDAVTAQTRTVSVAKGTPIFDWGENDFRFNVPVNLVKDIKFESGEQTAERKIQFGNAGGANPHQATLYGGDPNSATAIGMRDAKNNREIIGYNDIDNSISIGANGTKCLIGTNELLLQTPLRILTNMSELNNLPTGFSGFGGALIFGGDSSSDRYYILVDSNGFMYNGRALNGATTITWDGGAFGDGKKLASNVTDTTSHSVTFDGIKYKNIYIEVLLSANGAYLGTTIPVLALTSGKKRYQQTDEVKYISYYLSVSGTGNKTLTYQIATRSENAGKIVSIIAMP